jgi:hypothetical protein
VSRRDLPFSTSSFRFGGLGEVTDGGGMSNRPRDAMVALEREAAMLQNRHGKQIVLGLPWERLAARLRGARTGRTCRE